MSLYMQEARGGNPPVLHLYKSTNPPTALDTYDPDATKFHSDLPYTAIRTKVTLDTHKDTTVSFTNSFTYGGISDKPARVFKASDTAAYGDITTDIGNDYVFMMFANIDTGDGVIKKVQLATHTFSYIRLALSIGIEGNVLNGANPSWAFVDYTTPRTLFCTPTSTSATIDAEMNTLAAEINTTNSGVLLTWCLSFATTDVVSIDIMTLNIKKIDSTYVSTIEPIISSTDDILVNNTGIYISGNNVLDKKLLRFSSLNDSILSNSFFSTLDYTAPSNSGLSVVTSAPSAGSLSFSVNPPTTTRKSGSYYYYYSRAATSTWASMQVLAVEDIVNSVTISRNEIKRNGVVFIGTDVAKTNNSVVRWSYVFNQANVVSGTSFSTPIYSVSDTFLLMTENILTSVDDLANQNSRNSMVQAIVFENFGRENTLSYGGAAIVQAVSVPLASFPLDVNLKAVNSTTMQINFNQTSSYTISNLKFTLICLSNL